MIPSDAIKKADDALAKLQCLGNASAALVMLNAELIQKGMNDYAGWESLEVLGFAPGVLELGRFAVNEFDSAIESWRALAGEYWPQMEGSHEPVAKVNKAANLHLLGPGHLKVLDLENTAGQLCHCIELQCHALSLRHQPGAYDAGFRLKQALGTAFNITRKAMVDLEDAWLAMQVQRQGERKVAA